MQLSDVMVNPRTKRRKLDQSSKDSSSEIAEDESSSGSVPDGSPIATQTNGHSDLNGPALTSQKVSRSGSMGNAKRRFTSAMSKEQLMAASSAGKSSLITLQINDLLGEIRPNYDKLLSRLEVTLQRLRDIIRDLPAVSPMTVSEAEKTLRKETGISVPFPDPRPSKDTKYTFEYRRPTQIALVGSLQLQLGIKSKDLYTADLAITLPDSILQEKDFLNYRYFHKRAYYIAHLAAGIKKSAKDEFKLSYQYQDDIISKPTLVIEPTDSSPPGFTLPRVRIRIIPAIDIDFFPGNKTLATKCCLRFSEDTSSTPYYNASLRSEATAQLYHELLQRSIAECDAFRDVCRLGHLWLRQRGFGGSVSQGGFGPFEWAIICALLLHSGGAKGRPALSSRYTCLQYFKAILQFLAAKDLTDPLLLNGATCEIPQSDSPVLFDGASQMNVLFKMTPWSYQLLRQEARTTIEAFNSKMVDNFESIFLKRLDEDLARSDQCLLLEGSALFQNQDRQDVAQASCQRLHAVLSQALGNRVRLIHLSYERSPSWSIEKSFKRASRRPRQVRVGLLLDSDHVDRLVDHGPSAEDQVAAADFRKFWGEKAELRRFKDGSITESLVWSEETPVTQQVISYILQRHFGLSTTALNFLGDQVEHLVLSKSSALSRKSAFKVINDAFQSLTIQLRQLEGLPLSIRSILPASSQLRYASLSPLTPTRPIDIIIEFEGSARWPDSLPAIQRTKTAFLIKLGDLLSTSDSKITTRIGLENTVGPTSKYSNTSFLDIIFPSPTPHLLPPILFRLRIHHDRTLTLLQKALSSLTTPPSTRPALTNTLQSTTRHYVATPPHTTTFSRLCTLHPSLPQTIALLKTWTSSHHLTYSLPEEILEILAARPYLHPYPYTVPASAQTAFLRALSFIANWDWMNEPLILDLSATDNNNNNNNNNNREGSSGLTLSAVQNLQTRFTAWRKTLDPALNNVVWFVGTNLDETGVVWTQGARPQKVTAARFRALARASIELVKGKIRGMGTEGAGDWWRELFKSPLADFDFLIHLKKDVVKHHYHAAAGGDPSKPRGTRFKNLQLHQNVHINTNTTAGTGTGTDTDAGGGEELTSFDPIPLFLQDLDRTFSPNILFFYGGNGSRVMPGLWNPKTLARGKEWRVGMGCSSVPVAGLTGREGERDGEDGEEEKVEGVVNQRGMLAEMEMLGERLVERIEVVRDLIV